MSFLAKNKTNVILLSIAAVLLLGFGFLYYRNNQDIKEYRTKIAELDKKIEYEKAEAAKMDTYLAQIDKYNEGLENITSRYPNYQDSEYILKRFYDEVKKKDIEYNAINISAPILVSNIALTNNNIDIYKYTITFSNKLSYDVLKNFLDEEINGQLKKTVENVGYSAHGGRLEGNLALSYYFIDSENFDEMSYYKYKEGNHDLFKK